MSSQSVPAGALSMVRIPAPPRRPVVGTLREALAAGGPDPDLPVEVRRWRRANAQDFTRSLHDMAAWESGRLGFLGQLWGRVVRRDGAVVDLGLMSCRVVTSAGVNYIVDAFQNLVELENMKYHGVGTSSAAENASNTSLGAELTTNYSPANTRATGTTGEQSGSPNVYETTATVTVAGTVALTEHGILSQAAVGGGVLLDRSVFAAVNLAASESLQATYRLTFPAGS